MYDCTSNFKVLPQCTGDRRWQHDVEVEVGCAEVSDGVEQEPEGRFIAAASERGEDSGFLRVFSNRPLVRRKFRHPIEERELRADEERTCRRDKVCVAGCGQWCGVDENVALVLPVRKVIDHNKRGCCGCNSLFPDGVKTIVVNNDGGSILEVGPKLQELICISRLCCQILMAFGRRMPAYRAIA